MLLFLRVADGTVLQHVHPAICDLELLYIHIAVNVFSEIPECFSSLPLIDLVLSGNMLSTLPDAFARLKTLRYLDIQYNRFTSGFSRVLLPFLMRCIVPSCILTLPKLHTLLIAGNSGIRELPSELLHLPALYEMNVQYLELSPIAIDTLVRLMSPPKRLVVEFGDQQPPEEVLRLFNSTCAWNPEHFCQCCGLRCDAIPSSAVITLSDSHNAGHVHLSAAEDLICNNVLWTFREPTDLPYTYENCSHSGQNCQYTLIAPANRRIKLRVPNPPMHLYFYDGDGPSTPDKDLIAVGDFYHSPTATVLSHSNVLHFDYFLRVGSVYKPLDVQYELI